MDADRLLERYRELQSYLDWTDDDAARIVAAAPLVDIGIQGLVDDFYAEIERHPGARKVITGGQTQIDRLKGTLIQWVRELFLGKYDADYVLRRWRVGWRHVEIGLDQVYTNVALSRLRMGIVRCLQEYWQGTEAQLGATARSIHKLLDLDLAIIEDAYQSEYMLRLQRSERLATLGEVAGGVAHELRNPLNVVKTSVYYLLNARNPTPQKNAEHLNRIERNVELADNVISSLSSFAKIPIPELRPFGMETLVREALEVNPPKQGVEVAVDCPLDLPEALGDPDQLRIALGNLIRNANDAMASGGRLAIAGSTIDGCIEISVTDTGVGIDSKDLARIMEPLYSTKARGLGLGLSIARSIVEKNRGSLRVKSESGQGSTFTLRLNIAHPAGAG
jgi:two-component system NtrC family sensor kinase